MERLEAIEHLIEAGRDEAPGIVAERSREAVETVVAGVVAALASARQRLRSEPRRPSVARMLVIGLATAMAVAAIGFVLAALLQRAQRSLRQRQDLGRLDSVVQEAERASDALEPESIGFEPLNAPRAPVAIPVGAAEADDGSLGTERQERVPV